MLVESGWDEEYRLINKYKLKFDEFNKTTKQR